MTGTAIKRVILRKLKSFLIPLPPPLEQKQIRNILDYHLSIIENTEREILTNLRFATELRQSILKTAFEGKLVAQDPSDESAEKLLERIRKSKEKMNNQKKGTRSRRKTSKRSQRRLNGYVE
jgi:type I restriction enzyme S subunit